MIDYSGRPDHRTNRPRTVGLITSIFPPFTETDSEERTYWIRCPFCFKIIDRAENQNETWFFRHPGAGASTCVIDEMSILILVEYMEVCPILSMLQTCPVCSKSNFNCRFKRCLDDSIKYIFVHPDPENAFVSNLCTVERDELIKVTGQTFWNSLQLK